MESPRILILELSFVVSLYLQVPVLDFSLGQYCWDASVGAFGFSRVVCGVKMISFAALLSLHYYSGVCKFILKCPPGCSMLVRSVHFDATLHSSRVSNSYWSFTLSERLYSQQLPALRLIIAILSEAMSLGNY